ncbi:hypothetical protein MPSI1_000419 [Malassezia psittaci]|uniref:Uncharacterized protein n=1 Tax=Malassezia psittaci TaxID=1821823 RepID=A0AAF0FB97_9BASI|nr:hypothetical protein MPSI1_000419 [Malassezia psittaci]
MRSNGRRLAAQQPDVPQKMARVELEDDELSDGDSTEEGFESQQSSDEYEPPPELAVEERDDGVEIEPEGFSRLIHAFTDEPSGEHEERGSQSKAKSKWNRSMEEEMESFHHELRDVNGYARKSRSTRIREQALSPEVKALLAQANISYVEADLHKAIRQLEEVIRIEPTVKGAWYTLGMCFEELGEEEKSIQCRIVGAHLTSNASEEWKSLARRSRERGLLQQSIYCLQQAIKKNRFDLDAIWDRAMMLKDTGRHRAAIEAFQAILKIQPYDTEVLSELIPLLVSLGEYEIGVNILEKMRMASMRGEAVSDPNLDPALHDSAQVKVDFSLNELVTLADLLLLLKRPWQVILVIKQTIHWLRDDNFQDRTEHTRDDLDLDENAIDSLDREVRLRLGKARFMLKDFDEGKRHLSILADDADPVDCPVLFLEMADCYFEYQQYSEALDWYRTLIEKGYIDDLQAYVQMGMCYQHLDMSNEAAQVYESVLEVTPDNFDVKLSLAEVCEELGQRDRALQLVNEVLVTRSRLRSTNDQTEDAAKAGAKPTIQSEVFADGDNATLSFFDEANATNAHEPSTSGVSARNAKTSISFAERQSLEQQREHETRLAWVQLSALEPLVFVDGYWHPDFEFLDGTVEAAVEPRSGSEADLKRFDATRQWMQVAGQLVDSFRSMSLLFPKERYTKYRGVVRPRRNRRTKVSDLDSQADALLSRLRDRLVVEATLQSEEESEDNAPEQTAFRTISFDDWVALFMKYAVALAKIGGEDEAINDMFRHVMVSNTVWPSEERKTALHLCWLACAMYSCDFARVFDVARWFPTHYQFHNEPLRLIASIANGTGLYGIDAFVSATNTKQYQRRMRTQEAIANGRPAKINPRTGRWTTAGAEEDDQDDSIADGEPSRAWDMQPQPAPTKPSPISEMFYGYLMLCAGSYQPAMVLHALAAPPIVSAEAEYNFARAYHQLGLAHLAIPRYERVLDMAQDNLRPSQGYSMAHSSGGVSVTEWKPRAVVKYPTAEVGSQGLSYEAVSSSSLSFPEQFENAIYQIKLVHSDAFSERNHASESSFSNENDLLTFVKLCQLQSINNEPLQDSLRLHISRAPIDTANQLSSPKIIGVSYGIVSDFGYDSNACPVLNNSIARLTARFSTTLEISVPVVPDAPMRIGSKAEEGTAEEGENPKSKNEPLDLMAMAKKYWYFIVPLVVLLIIPMPEDVQAAPSDAPSGPPRQARVTPGPGKGSAPAYPARNR